MWTAKEQSLSKKYIMEKYFGIGFLDYFIIKWFFVQIKTFTDVYLKKKLSQKKKTFESPSGLFILLV